MSEQTVELPVWWEKENKASGKGKVELVEMLNKLFEQAREAQRPYAAKWKKYDLFYRGHQWERALEKWRAQITVNVCFPTIENQLAVMADASIRSSVMPVEGGDYATAQASDGLLYYGFQKHEWPLEFVLGQKTALQYGGAAFKTGWDPDLGLDGDVSLTRVSPKCLIPDPMAKSIEECRYVFEAKILTLAEIRRMYGKAADKLKPDDGIYRMDEKETGITEIKESSDYDKPVLTPDEEMGAMNKTVKGIRDLLAKVLYIECWLRDESYVEEKVTDEDGKVVKDEDGKPEVVRKRIYPGGRHICFVGETILKDEKNPFWHQQFPYIVMPNYPDIENLWGISEIENLLSLQNEINHRRSQVADNATAHGNPVWVKDSQSGVKTGDLGNRPNLVITKRMGTEVRRESPPQIPQYIVDGHRQSIQDAEYVSGMHEVLQGQQPGSVRDFSAIRAVQEIAERRVRMKMEFQQAAIRKIGRQLIALYMQYYPSDRWARVLGKQNVENLIAARLQADPPLNVDEDDKPVKDELVFQLEEVFEMYDYQTQAETMTRNTRELYREQLKDLRQLIGPALDEALLKAYDIENWQEIIKEIKKPEPEQPPMMEPVPEQLPPEALMGGAGQPAPALPGPPAPPAGGEIPPDLLQALMMTGGNAPPGAPPL